MEINKIKEGDTLILNLEGRLDSNTASQLEEEIKGQNDIGKLVLNLEKLVYLSSAGLRVILSAQKMMNKQGKMLVKNVNETIMEVFEMTGFCDILTIE